LGGASLHDEDEDVRREVSTVDHAWPLSLGTYAICWISDGREAAGKAAVSYWSGSLTAARLLTYSPWLAYALANGRYTSLSS
jgi:hypothetical protein